MRTNSTKRFSVNSSNNAAVRRAANVTANHMEGLESRQLRSVSLSNGVLTVSGSVGADRQEVDQYLSDIYVFENGILTKLVPASSVTRIVMRGSAGDDFMKIWNGVTKPSEMYGDDGADTMYGGVMGEYMNGGNGNDYMDGGAGADGLWGGEGNDWIFGRAGNDNCGGGGGADYIGAGLDNDYVWGESGNDTLYGEAGNDWIAAGDGADYVGCSTGNDTVYGGWGADRIYGEGGYDVLYGEGDNDTITGGANNDTMYGGDGNDYFYASDDTWDYINGGNGYDTASCDIDHWWEFDADDSRVSIEYAYE